MTQINSINSTLRVQQIKSIVCQVACSSASSFADLTGSPSDNAALAAAIDAKVAQTITDGVTTSAPSQNAVFDALALKQNALGFTPSRRLHHKNNVSDSFTSTTNESILASVQVPVGSFAANDVVRVRIRVTKTGTAGTITVRGRIHTSGGAVGSAFASGTQFFTSGSQAATIVFIDMERSLRFKNSLSSITCFNTALANITLDMAMLGASGTLSTLTNDFALEQFIVITAQLGNSGDTAVIDGIEIEIIRS